VFSFKIELYFLCTRLDKTYHPLMPLNETLIGDPGDDCEYVLPHGERVAQTCRNDVDGSFAIRAGKQKETNDQRDENQNLYRRQGAEDL
jgi:hypothetical protein